MLLQNIEYSFVKPFYYEMPLINHCGNSPASYKMIPTLIKPAITEMTMPATASPLLLFPLNPSIEQVAPSGSIRIAHQTIPTMDEINPIRALTSLQVNSFFSGFAAGGIGPGIGYGIEDIDCV